MTGVRVICLTHTCQLHKILRYRSE